MINTIFYFVKSLDEYNSQWQSGNITARTIVFVEDEHAIYKGGTKYSGLSVTELTNLLNQVDNSKINGDITNIQNNISLHTTRIDALADQIAELKALLGLKGDAKDISSLFTSVDAIKNDITALQANGRVYFNSITDLTNRMASAEAGLTAKADGSNVYTKAEIDGKITKVSEDISAVSSLVASTKTDLEKKIAEAVLEGVAGVDLSGLYTKEDVDGLIEEVNTKISAEAGLRTKAIGDLENRISSAETSLTAKANASEVYTKTEIDGKVTTINTDISAVSSLVQSTKADLEGKIASVETSLTSKASLTDVYTKTDVDGKISTVENKIISESGVKSAADVRKVFTDDGDTLYTAKSYAELFAKIESDIAKTSSGFATENWVEQKISQIDSLDSNDVNVLIAKAFSEQYSSIDDVKAYVATLVTKDSNGNINSQVKISGDNVLIGGDKLTDFINIDTTKIDEAYTLYGIIPQIKIDETGIIVGVTTEKGGTTTTRTNTVGVTTGNLDCFIGTASFNFTTPHLVIDGTDPNGTETGTVILGDGATISWGSQPSDNGNQSCITGHMMDVSGYAISDGIVIQGDLYVRQDGTDVAKTRKGLTSIVKVLDNFYMGFVNGILVYTGTTEPTDISGSDNAPE